MSNRTTGVLANTCLFLAPLLIAYSATLLSVTAVPLMRFGFVAGLFLASTAIFGGLIYLGLQGIPALLGRRRFVCPDRAAWMGLGAACIVVLMPSFGVFKQALLPMQGFTLDPFFAAMGRTALGGSSPWQVTHALFGSVWATIFIDQIYTAWSLLFFIFPLLFPFFTRDAALRAQVLIAWVLAWLLIGTLGAWAMGSAGPCYYNDLVGPDANFLALNQRLAGLYDSATRMGIELSNVSFQSTLLARFHEGKYVMAGGISAMPSMHVTMAVLIALAGWRVARPLGHVLAGYAVLIWLGSIHFGWHYGVDGPVALILMLWVWRLSGWIVRAVTAPADARPHSSGAIQIA